MGTIPGKYAIGRPSPPLYPEAFDGLIASYVPAFGTQGGRVLDFSGHGHHGTMASPLNWIGGGISLDQIASIQLPVVLPVEKCSIIVRARIGKINSDAQWLFGSSTSNRAYIYMNSGSTTDDNLKARKSGSANFGFKNLLKGQVFSAALTWSGNGSDSDFYVHGLLEGSVNNVNTNTFTNVSIGAFNTTAGIWQGPVYSCHIYDRKIPQSLIRLLSRDHLAPYRERLRSRSFVSSGGGPTFNPAWAIGEPSIIGGPVFA